MSEMISVTDMVKALSLECLSLQTVEQSDRNNELFKELDKLDKTYKGCSCESDRIPVLAKVYEICLMMDVVAY